MGKGNTTEWICQFSTTFFAGKPPGSNPVSICRRERRRSARAGSGELGLLFEDFNNIRCDGGLLRRAKSDREEASAVPRYLAPTRPLGVSCLRSGDSGQQGEALRSIVIRSSLSLPQVGPVCQACGAARMRTIFLLGALR